MANAPPVGKTTAPPGGKTPASGSKTPASGGKATAPGGKVSRINNDHDLHMEIKFDMNNVHNNHIDDIVMKKISP